MARDHNNQSLHAPPPEDAVTLLLDMDGVLADFDGLFWQRCLDAGYTFDVATREEQAFRFFTEHMPDERERKLARAMVEEPGWFADLPLVPGAQDAVDQLLAHPRLDVWVCTKPLEVNPTCRDEKGSWLRRHLPELEDRLIIAPDKAYVVGDYLLDDAPHGPSIERACWHPLVYRTPYNEAGSEWEGLFHWDFQEPLDRLLQVMGL